MRAKVSVCFIVRDDADSGLLVDCFESVRPYVEEIVVVDTGSKDATPEIARRYADVFEVFTECNDPETGAMADFAMARNRSFELATQPWLMWMDSDDKLRGGELLAKLTEIGDATKGDKDLCWLLPYEYAYNAQGKCVCLHYRERLVSRKGAMRWANAVHEVLIPADTSSLQLLPCEDVVFEHHRQRSTKPTSPGRNLKILQKVVEQDGSTDARQYYYLGLEYGNSGDLAKAEEWLTKYVGVSGWIDEKAMALLKLAELANATGRPDEALVWGFRAIGEVPEWGEGYFAIARAYHSMAMRPGIPARDSRRSWQKCVHFGEAGLALPPTKTMLFVNPLERDLEIRVFLTMAYSQLGNARKAAEHAAVALRASPDDPNLVYNKKTFDKIIARDDARRALDALVAAGGITAEMRDEIAGALSGVGGGPAAGWERWERPADYPRGVEERHFPVARRSPHARAFMIPEVVDLDDLPVRMTEKQVEAATILLWKELLRNDELAAAESLLRSAPILARDNAEIAKALARTRKMRAEAEAPALGFPCVAADASSVWYDTPYGAPTDPVASAAREGRVWTMPGGDRAAVAGATPWSVVDRVVELDPFPETWVRDSHVVKDADGRDVVRARVEVSRPRPSGGSLDVVFACGDAWEEWSPRVHREKGIGGSETAVVEVARRLSLAGHRVRVFTSTGKAGEGVYDGVEYRRTEMLGTVESCDVLVAWRDAGLLPTVVARAKLLWVHDVFASRATHRHLLQADRVLALSEWHRGHLATQHNLHPRQLVRTRNGIDLARFDQVVERNPHKLVASSSPDRYLPVMLSVWPRIRQKVPDAELHVFYGFDNWRKIAELANNPDQLRAISVLEEQLARLAGDGVVSRGRVDQATLAREFLSAGVWAYPTWFSETSCITAMEAQAAGLRIVTSPIAALSETVGESGVLIAGDWLTPAYQDRFVDEVVRALDAPEGEWVKTRAGLAERARRDFGWDSLAAEWEAMFFALLAELETSPLLPYQGRADFKREAA